MIFSLPSPIPRTVKDKDDLHSAFSRFAIIPYYGTSEGSSQQFLDLLTTLTELSPTFQATRADLAEYTFGTNFDVVARAIPGLVQDETQPIDFQQKVAYVESLNNIGVTLPRISKTFRALDSHLDICGNAYLHLKRIEVGGTVRYYMRPLHYKHCAYLKSRDDGREFIIHSRFLTELNKMLKHPPTILPATDQDSEIQWASTEPGTEEAIIHLKRGSANDESSYYARPRILSVLTWLYIDYQIGNLNSKVAATELVSKKILAFEEPDPNRLREVEEDENGEVREYLDGNIGAAKPRTLFQRNMLTLKKLVTNLGAHQSASTTEQAAATIAGIEYPRGEKPPTEISLEVNRDTKHHTWQQDTAVSMISAALRWAPELTGIRKTGSSLGGNLLYDMFTMKNTATIQPRQVEFADIINGVLNQLLERENAPAEQRSYGLELPDIIGTMITDLKGDTNTQPGAPTEPDINTEDNDEGVNDNA